VTISAVNPARYVVIPQPSVLTFTPATVNPATVSRTVAIATPVERISKTFAAPAITRTVTIATPSVSGGSGSQPLSNQFFGAPPFGKFYIGWASGPATSGHTGTTNTNHASIAAGQQTCQNTLSVRHNYSTDTRAMPSAAIMDEAIAADMISSQSFKMNTAGREMAGANELLAGARDADLDTAISRCQARAPHPIWLSFYHEPGGDWVNDPDSGNTLTSPQMRALFRQCYRYICQYFRDNGNPSNVCFQPILEAPYDFRPSSYSPGGRRNIDWRELCPDWNGGNTRTIADWYTGADRMMDAFGLDIYNPLVVLPTVPQPTQDYSNIWQSVLSEFQADGFPYQDYAFNIMEMGWSDTPIDPDPNWNAYAVEVLTAQAQFNITTFTWWDINNGDVNNSTPRYCLTTPAADVNGDKLTGWRSICNDPDRVIWTP